MYHIGNSVAAAYCGKGAFCVCCCCLSDRICVWALILLKGFTVTRVLVTSLFVLSLEACVSTVETRFGDAVCARPRKALYVHGFSPVTSHRVNSLSPFTCNRFCGSGIAGVTSQDFNTPFYGPWTVFVAKVDWSYSPMVSSGVMFDRVVGKIVFTWFPEDVKLSLGGLVLEPIESHVNGFGKFLFDCSC